MATKELEKTLRELSAQVSITEESIASSSKSIELAIKQEEYESKRQDREQRKDYANKLYKFLGVYMLCVLGLLLLSGSDFVCFHLSDAVLLAILGTTTANIVSIFVIVAKYLFPANK